MSTEIIQMSKEELQSIIIKAQSAVIEEYNKHKKVKTRKRKDTLLDFSKDKEICTRTVLAIFDRIGFFEFMEGKISKRELSSLLSALIKVNSITLNVYKNSIYSKKESKYSVVQKHYQKADEILERLKFKK